MKFPPTLKTVEEKRAYALGMIHSLWNYAWYRDGVQYVGSGNSTYYDAFFKIVNAFKAETGEELGSTAKYLEDELA